MLKSIDTTAIASLNDTARRTLTGCRVQMTPVEKIVKLEKKMSQVQTQYKDAEANYGTDLLNLVVAKGYLSKLTGNSEVRQYLSQHYEDILDSFELVVNTVSMEQALEDNDHSAALDEDENDVAVDTGEKPEEYETGDD